MKAHKSLLFPIILLLFIFSSIETTYIYRRPTTKTWRRRSLHITSGSINDDLTNLSTTTYQCILTNGVNSITFNDCFAPKYTKLSSVFYKYFQTLGQSVLSNLRQNLSPSCTQITQQCEAFYSYTTTQIYTNQNVLSKIRLAAKNLQVNNKLSGTTIKGVMNSFEQDYNQFINARLDISKKLKDTIFNIQNYIKQTGIRTSFDYTTVDSTQGSDLIDIQINQLTGQIDIKDDADSGSSENGDSDQAAYFGVDQFGNQVSENETADESINSQIKIALFNSNDINGSLNDGDNKSPNQIIAGKLVSNTKKFYLSLFGESDNLLKIQFLIASGRIDGSQLDMSLLPSVILANLQKQNLTIS